MVGMQPTQHNKKGKVVNMDNEIEIGYTIRQQKIDTLFVLPEHIPDLEPCLSSQNYPKLMRTEKKGWF